MSTKYFFFLLFYIYIYIFVMLGALSAQYIMLQEMDPILINASMIMGYAMHGGGIKFWCTRIKLPDDGPTFATNFL
jgi:hypothetical protein